MPKMLENAQASLAQEEGCLQFDVCQSTEQDNTVYLYEVYHQQDFNLDLKNCHYTEFADVTAPWVEDKTVSRYQRINSSTSTTNRIRNMVSHEYTR